MIEDLVKNLNSENQELQMHCASAIFKVSWGLFHSVCICWNWYEPKVFLKAPDLGCRGYGTKYVKIY